MITRETWHSYTSAQKDTHCAIAMGWTIYGPATYEEWKDRAARGEGEDTAFVRSDDHVLRPGRWVLEHMSSPWSPMTTYTARDEMYAEIARRGKQTAFIEALLNLVAADPKPPEIQTVQVWQAIQASPDALCLAFVQICGEMSYDTCLLHHESHPPPDRPRLSRRAAL